MIDRHFQKAMLGCAGLTMSALAMSALAMAGQAHAQGAVAIDSAVYVERIGESSERILTPAQRLNRGDRVVYLLDWSRPGGTGGFVVTSPVSRATAYQGTANADEEVSADGGRTWGQLGSLRYGNRLALAEDVTHVRWRIAPLAAAKGTGRIAYSAIVR